MRHCGDYSGKGCLKMSNKTSAKSKGYRPSQTDKKKREMRTMYIGLAVFAVIIIGVVVGVRIYETYGVLDVADGVVQNVEDTWILKNTGDRSSPRVFKMAEMTAPVEGYTLETPDRSINQTLINYYNADDETNPVSQYYVLVATGDYDEISAQSYEQLGGYVTILRTTEVQTTEINGMDVCYYSYDYSMDTSEAQDGSEIRYFQSLNAYFESRFDGYSILISVGDEVADENSFATEDELMAVMEAAAANLVVCGRAG